MQEPGAQLYAFARQGVWHGVRALGLGVGDGVLVPAYHHGSEVEALNAAGLQCAFYGGGDGVRPVPSELEALLTPRTRALYLIHTLGFPQDSRAWRRWCDERGLLLIEDAAQAWLTSRGGSPVGAGADLAVYCAYKSVPVPEGAFVLARTDIPPPAPNSSWGLPDIARRHGAWLAQRSSIVTKVAEWGGLTYVPDPEAELDLRLDKTGPWSTTDRLLRRLADPSAAAVRRAHYRLLLDHLDGAVPAPFIDVPDGAAPFVFPLQVQDKARTLARLAAAGVHAMDVWSEPHQLLTDGRFPEVDRLRNSLVGLPVHQQLRPRDLASVARAVAPRRPGRRLQLEPLPDLVSAEAPWRRLAERAPHPFATYEWALAWHESGGRDDVPVLALCHDASGREVALIALARGRSGPIRTLRFYAGEPADLAGPVCDPDDEVSAAHGLRALLATTASWDVMLGERLPGGAAWPTLMSSTSAHREASPSLSLPFDGWSGLLASRSSNFRQQVRRRERQLVQRHGATFRLATPETLDRDLETLFRLHDSRWPAGTEFSARRRFHQHFARLAAARGWLRLWLLEAGGAPVAAWYGFRYADQEWYYQAGRDPAWDGEHVGFVLLAHTVRAAADDGMASYRLLRGNEPYKHRFATHDSSTDTVVIGRGVLGRAAAESIRAAGTLPTDLRQRVRAVLPNSALPGSGWPVRGPVSATLVQ